MDRERFIRGRDAIFAEYCRRVEPMYQRMVAEKDTLYEETAE